MKSRFQTYLLLLICALVLGACGFGIQAAFAGKARREALARETQANVEQLAAFLSALREGREAYLDAREALEADKNAYETQKDLVRIAAEAVEKRREALARDEADGTLAGNALAEAKKELAELTAGFNAQKAETERYEALRARAEAYADKKARARALLETLRSDTRIREKLDAGMGPLAAAREALCEELAALRRQFYIMLALFAALGAAALVVAWRTLRAHGERK